MITEKYTTVKSLHTNKLFTAIHYIFGHACALWQTPTIWWQSKLTQNTIDPCLLSTDCAVAWPLFKGTSHDCDNI